MTKTKWLVGGVVTSLMTGTLFGCAQDLPPKPNDNSCSDWDWDDEENGYIDGDFEYFNQENDLTSSEIGVWQCDDSSSGYRGHYFYGGRYYQNKSTFKNSSAFKSYQSSAEFKGGIGSGSKGGFGG